MSSNSDWSADGTAWSTDSSPNATNSWDEGQPAADTDRAQSSWPNENLPKEQSVHASCFVCEESNSQDHIINTGCFSYPGHHVCHDCFRHGVESATTDEKCYPISCADGHHWGSISDALVGQILCDSTNADKMLLEKYEAKREEYSTPLAFRTYCASEECRLVQGHAQYLNAEIMGNDISVICPDCNSVTCRLCKLLIISDQQHVCNTEEYDAQVKEFLDTLPEDERWLWQRCPHCMTWTEKTEYCNHMTCHCGGEFCLICGRKWTGLQSCSHGCPKHKKPTYDVDGYCNETGFHRETGRNRDGVPADPNIDYEMDPDGGYGDDHYNDDQDDGWQGPIYDERGLDQRGRDVEGFDEQGFGKMHVSSFPEVIR